VESSDKRSVEIVIGKNLQMFARIINVNQVIGDLNLKELKIEKVTFFFH